MPSSAQYGAAASTPRPMTASIAIIGIAGTSASPYSPASPST
ncbi:MAG: hypothetical protein ACK5BN_18525 [Planctomycetota bacterium]